MLLLLRGALRWRPSFTNEAIVSYRYGTLNLGILATEGTVKNAYIFSQSVLSHRVFGVGEVDNRNVRSCSTVVVGAHA